MNARTMALVALCSIAGVGMTVGCGDDNTASNLTADSLTIVSTAALDGFVISDSTGSAGGGGPLVGDFDAVAPGKTYRTLYSFDITAFPAGAVLDSARLRLFLAAHTTTPFTELGNVIVDHVDYGATFEGSDYYAGALQSNIGVIATDTIRGYKSLGVSSSVQADLTAARTRTQFRLRFSTTDGNNDGTNDYVQFGDAELSCCAVDSVPQLKVYFRH
jgi:hypothetical protein